MSSGRLARATDHDDGGTDPLWSRTPGRLVDLGGILWPSELCAGQWIALLELELEPGGPPAVRAFAAQARAPGARRQWHCRQHRPNARLRRGPTLRIADQPRRVELVSRCSGQIERKPDGIRQRGFLSGQQDTDLAAQRTGRNGDDAVAADHAPMI